MQLQYFTYSIQVKIIDFDPSYADYVKFTKAILKVLDNITQWRLVTAINGKAENFS